MSINVYLRGDEVTKLDGFKQDTAHMAKLNGIALWLDEGRWHSIMAYATDSIPPILEDLVVEISLHERLPQEIRRESGIYRLEDAKAEVETADTGRDKFTRVRIRGMSMANIASLLRLIKTGEIRPEQSYEGKQNGMSRLELEAELENYKYLKTKLAELEAMIPRLDQFYRELLATRWPWLSASGVSKRVREILIAGR